MILKSLVGQHVFTYPFVIRSCHIVVHGRYEVIWRNLLILADVLSKVAADCL